MGGILNKNELTALLQLTNVPGIGPARIRALVSHFRSVETVLNASVSALCQVSGIDRSLAGSLRAADNSRFAEQQLQTAERKDCTLVSFWDKRYPNLLKKIHDPPVLIYAKGKIRSNDQNAIAVVGTRAPTQYGKLATERLVVGLVDRGLTIVSGLARGIDTTAHHTAVKQGGRTIAVLGSGVDVLYPAENLSLAQEIIQNGAIISEFPFGTKPDAVNFPRRNRIISGLSLGVVVVEAGLESGAMITTNFALNQGREVFAVPGNIMNNKSAGPHQLIKEGAKLVHDVDDIIDELSAQLELFSNESIEKKQPPDLDGEALLVFQKLSHELCHIDELNRDLSLPLPQLMGILLDLEFKNLIKQFPGKFFVKAR